MIRVKSAALGAAVVLSATTVGVVGSADAAPTTQGSTAGLAGCIEMGSAGHQIWRGPATSGASAALGDALEAIADANHEQVSGVAACSDYSGAAIFVAGPSRELLDQIAAVGAKYPGAALHVENVAHGLTAQLAAGQRVMSTDRSGAALTRIGPNIYTGGLSVDVHPDQWPVSDALRHQVIAAATSNGEVAMPVDFGSGGQIVNAGAPSSDAQR